MGQKNRVQSGGRKAASVCKSAFNPDLSAGIPCTKESLWNGREDGTDAECADILHGDDAGVCPKRLAAFLTLKIELDKIEGPFLLNLDGLHIQKKPQVISIGKPFSGCPVSLLQPLRKVMDLT